MLMQGRLAVAVNTKGRGLLRTSISNIMFTILNAAIIVIKQSETSWVTNIS